MKRQLIKLAVFLLVMLLVFPGCRTSSGEKPKPQTGRMEFGIIELESSEFKELNKDDFRTWYEGMQKVEGAHSYTMGYDRYVLISAGEKPTAGYSMEDVIVVGREGSIDISVRLYAPKEGELVAQVITYPHLLIMLADDARRINLDIKGAFHDDNKDSMTDTGRYAGFEGNDSIKVKITGVPDEMAPRVFKLSEDIRDKVLKLGLVVDETVIFDYITDQNGKPVIIKLERK